MDVVLGYGSHADMAGALAPAIKEVLDKAKGENRQLHVIASVTGTRQDPPQNYDATIATLKQAGALIEDSNAKAVRLALKFKGIAFKEIEKAVKEVPVSKIELPPKPSEAVMELLTTKPRVINIGLESFNESIGKFGGESIQYNWKPIAGGNKKLIRILNALAKIESIDEANQKVVDRMLEAQPFLVDVVPAKSVIPPS